MTAQQKQEHLSTIFIFFPTFIYFFSLLSILYYVIEFLLEFEGKGWRRSTYQCINWLLIDMPYPYIWICRTQSSSSRYLECRIDDLSARSGVAIFLAHYLTNQGEMGRRGVCLLLLATAVPSSFPFSRLGCSLRLTSSSTSSRGPSPFYTAGADLPQRLDRMLANR